MSIQLIDKIKQKNDGNFYLVDAVDVEYNKKSLIDALKAGDIIPAGGGTSAGTSTWPTSTSAQTPRSIPRNSSRARSLPAI